MDTLKSFVVALAFFAFFAAPHALAVKGGVESDIPYSPYDPYDVYPIVDGVVSGQYGSNGNTVSPNPTPGQLNPGNQFLAVPYVDSNGVLYDLQVNLTTKTMRVMTAGMLVGVGNLTEAEAAEIRALIATVNPDDPQPEFLPILLPVLAGIIGMAVTIGYGEYADHRDCQREQISALRVVAAQIAACRADGKDFTVSMPSAALCGMDAHVSCH